VENYVQRLDETVLYTLRAAKAEMMCLFQEYVEGLSVT
jgi:hypothetical protein